MWNNRFVLKVKLFNTKIPQSSALLPLRSCRSFYCCCNVQRFSKSHSCDRFPTRAWRRNENKTASNWFSKTATLYVLFGPYYIIKVFIWFWQRTLILKFRSFTVHKTFRRQQLNKMATRFISSWYRTINCVLELINYRGTKSASMKRSELQLFNIHFPCICFIFDFPFHFHHVDATSGQQNFEIILFFCRTGTNQNAYCFGNTASVYI